MCLTTLESERLTGDQVEVLQILNGYENIDKHILLSVKEDRRTKVVSIYLKLTSTYTLRRAGYA